jgi:hypothetical protein
MPIVWTDKARAELTARRPEDVPPFKRGNPQTIWAGIRKSLAPNANTKYDPIDGTFVKGRPRTTPELGALMEKCEVLARSDEPPRLDEVDVAAAFTTLLAKITHERVSTLLLASTALPFAFETTLRGRDFAVTPQYLSTQVPFQLNGAPLDAQIVDGEWRNILLAQPKDVRDQCKEIATRYLAQSPNLGQRTTIAYVFCGEPGVWETLGNDVARAWLATGNTRNPTLHAMVTDFDLARELVMKKDGSWAYYDLIQTFGDRMLPLLIELAASPFDRWHSRDVAEALGLFDEPDAAKAMVKLLNLSASRPHALVYFGRFPHHANAALEALDGLKGRTAKIAREVLAGAQRALAGAVSTEDEATADEMPRVLAKPPWLDEKKPKRPVTKLELARIDMPEHVEWQPGERERAQKLFPRPDKPASAETLADYAKVCAEGKWVEMVKHKNEALPDDVILSSWNTGQKTYGHGATLGQKAQYILATFGDAAWPGVEHFVEHLANGWGDAAFMTRVASFRVVLPFAEHIGHRRIGKLAWAWLQKHAELAVVTLVPVAFGDDEARQDAWNALFRLKASGVDVIGIGARYGKEAKAALEKLFSWDPLYDLPKTIPKLGASWHPETLTRPRLLGAEGAVGKPLPLAALETIAAMLAFSPLHPPYAGIVQLKEACDPRSLAELSWEAARAWEHAGHKKKDKWMLMSLVHFADDEVVRRLTPGVRPDWAVEVLEIIATDAALMEMATIAERTASQGHEWGLAARIERILEAAAEARGVTKDELEEDLAPTTHLEEDGSLVLDYGSRKLHVGFDERLEPYVKTESGGRSRAVPPKRKEDDEAKVEHAKTIWRDLKEDVSVIGARRIKALDRAMTSGRTWTVERFRRVWLDHRLMKHIARGVVWLQVRKDGSAAFRVAEDGSLSDVDDAPLALSADAKIGVAHPLRLPEGDVAKWCTLFEDYKIMQSFPQVGRQYVAVDDAATRMSWPYATLPVQDLVVRLTGRGFKRGAFVQGKYTYERALSRGGLLKLEFKSDKNVVGDAFLSFTRDGNEVPAKELDRIELGDAIFELQG